MADPVHEIVFDLEPPVTAESGRRYRPVVVGTPAADGHWSAWLEFAAADSPEILRTGIETHQASEADLHRWAATLSDVYLKGALKRAVVSPQESAAHRRVLGQVQASIRGAAAAFDPFEFFALGEHVLRRELQQFTGAVLRAIVINWALNPPGFDLSKFTKAQLVTFIVTAVEAQHVRAHGAPGRTEDRSLVRDVSKER
jgi:hypothetical protein